MTTLNYEKAAASINFQVMQAGDHKRIAQQGRLQLEMMIKTGINAFVRDNSLTQEQSRQLHVLHKAAIDHANGTHADITNNKALSEGDLNKYLRTYLGELENKIAEYNIAAESGPKMRLK